MNDPRQIAFSMRRVPRLGDGWRYVPLNQLPEGTRVDFVVEPLKYDKEERLVNGKPEINVLGLPEGRYTLLIEIWPSCTLICPDGVKMSVRPLYDCLAPSSKLNVNYEKECPESENVQKTETYRLTTGEIQGIFIVGTHFKLTKGDLKEEKLSEAKKFRYNRGRRRPWHSLRNRQPRRQK